MLLVWLENRRHTIWSERKMGHLALIKFWRQEKNGNKEGEKGRATNNKHVMVYWRVLPGAKRCKKGGEHQNNKLEHRQRSHVRFLLGCTTLQLYICSSRPCCWKVFKILTFIHCTTLRLSVKLDRGCQIQFFVPQGAYWYVQGSSKVYTVQILQLIHRKFCS